MLTFVGFLLTVSNALLLCYYDYDFYASSDSRPEISPIPSWVWIVCAINHFLAHTLDGIDGKHARRTKSSGPTGELMDHGLDSWTALFVPFCIYSMFGRADHSYAPFRVLFIFWAVFVTFYLSHWEKYNTGILYLPWSYDLSQIALFVLYVITYIYTPKAWKHKLPILNISTGQIFEIVTHGKNPYPSFDSNLMPFILFLVMSFLLSVPVTVYNVYCCYKSRTLKQPNIWESSRPLIPILTLFLTTTAWAAYSPNQIIEVDPKMFYFLVGTIFSNIAVSSSE